MLIRPATHSDAAAIAALWNPVIRDTLITFNAREKSAVDIRAMIDTKIGRRKRFSGGRKRRQRCWALPPTASSRSGVGYARTMEHTVVLAPTAQGKGTGRALMNAIEAHARTRGAHSMFAGVTAANPAGVAFHRACGYTEVATLHEVGYKSGHWLDLVLLQKFL